MRLDLSPKDLSEYIGNENTRKIIKISINACKERGVTLGHTLITGQRGTGKTTLATLIAKELNRTYKVISAEAIVKLSDLVNLLLNNLPQILIIDEIHNIKPNLSDYLHQAMDSFEFSYMDENGEIITAQTSPFSVLGATTDEGKLTAPMYSRFSLKFNLLPYTASNLQKIVMNVAKNNGIDIDTAAGYEIAVRSNGIPRIAVLHFKNVYDYALMYNKGVINHTVAMNCLSLHGVDRSGLNDVQREILKVLSISKKPIGADNLCQRVGIGIEALIKLYEPPLLSAGFIKRASTGREITQAGRAHLGKK